MYRENLLRKSENQEKNGRLTLVVTYHSALNIEKDPARNIEKGK